VLVAHAYNPSYSEGRDQGGSCFKVSQGKKFTRPYLENTQYKNRAGRVAEFKSQSRQKKKKKKKVTKQGIIKVKMKETLAFPTSVGFETAH
jgi:hypothetical protein